MVLDSPGTADSTRRSRILWIPYRLPYLFYFIFSFFSDNFSSPTSFHFSLFLVVFFSIRPLQHKSLYSFQQLKQLLKGFSSFFLWKIFFFSLITFFLTSFMIIFERRAAAVRWTAFLRARTRLAGLLNEEKTQILCWTFFSVSSARQRSPFRIMLESKV